LRQTLAAANSSFNPRPRAGGDAAGNFFFAYLKAFQSTPPCGGRHIKILSFAFYIRVSIHAPVRGATPKCN